MLVLVFARALEFIAIKQQLFLKKCVAYQH